jgi:uncharacterized protein DUF3108
MSLVISVLLAGALAAQSDTTRTVDSYPFKIGERLEYSAKLGFLRLGTGVMEVVGTDTVRGHSSFKFQFGLDVDSPIYKSRNLLQSWTGVSDMVSRRFYQDLTENGRKKQRYYEIYPDSQIFRQQNRPNDVYQTVTEPLDDAAFFYFLRSLPLEVGKTYTYQRYFRREFNPVVVKVLKRETMELPDKREVPCLVLAPVAGNEGTFAPRAEARLWLTDDERRLPVQVRSRLPFGTVTLRLEKATLPDDHGAPAR